MLRLAESALTTPTHRSHLARLARRFLPAAFSVTPMTSPHVLRDNRGSRTDYAASLIPAIYVGGLAVRVEVGVATASLNRAVISPPIGR